MKRFDSFHLFFSLEGEKMNKIKLIIHERFSGKRSHEAVFLSAIQSESWKLLQDKSSSIMGVTEQSQDSFCSGKELKMEQMSNENKIYNATLYCRLSKDDEQAGESVSIGTQKMILEKFYKEQDLCL